MHKALKHSLIYVVSMLVILILLASYFFIQMDASLRAGQADTARLKEQETLRAQSAKLSSSITEFENKLAELEQRITQRQAELATLQTADTDTQCGAVVADDTELQNQLATSQAEAHRCATALKDKDAAVESLSRDIEALQVTEKELASASTVIQTLRTELTQTRQQYDRQLQAARNQAENDDATQVSTLAAKQAASALNRANQDIATLQARLQQLQAKNEELEATTRSSGKLEITEFNASPNYCRAELSGEEVCLTSIDISATFNFSPNGFIAMIIFDPNGDIIGRESIAGRTINQVSFKLDAQTPALAGEYVIEFRINDVFNRFSVKKSFTVSPS